MDEIKERVSLKKNAKQVRAVIAKMTTKASLHGAMSAMLLLGMLGAGDAAESDTSADMGFQLVEDESSWGPRIRSMIPYFLCWVIGCLTILVMMLSVPKFRDGTKDEADKTCPVCATTTASTTAWFYDAISNVTTVGEAFHMTTSIILDQKVERVITWICTGVLMLQTACSWCVRDTNKKMGLEPAAAPTRVTSVTSVPKSETATVVYKVPEAVYITPNGECYRARTCKNVDLNTAKCFVSGRCCAKKVRNGE